MDGRQLAATHFQQVAELHGPPAPTIAGIPDFHGQVTSPQGPTLFTPADQMNLRHQYYGTQPAVQSGMHDAAVPQDFSTMGSADPHNVPTTPYPSSTTYPQLSGYSPAGGNNTHHKYTPAPNHPGTGNPPTNDTHAPPNDPADVSIMQQGTLASTPQPGGMTGPSSDTIIVPDATESTSGKQTKTAKCVTYERRFTKNVGNATDEQCSKMDCTGSFTT